MILQKIGRPGPLSRSTEHYMTSLIRMIVTDLSVISMEYICLLNVGRTHFNIIFRPQHLSVRTAVCNYIILFNCMSVYSTVGGSQLGKVNTLYVGLFCLTNLQYYFEVFFNCEKQVYQDLTYGSVDSENNRP